MLHHISHSFKDTACFQTALLTTGDMVSMNMPLIHGVYKIMYNIIMYIYSYFDYIIIMYYINLTAGSWVIYNKDLSG